MFQPQYLTVQKKNKRMARYNKKQTHTHIKTERKKWHRDSKQGKNVSFMFVSCSFLSFAVVVIVVVVVVGFFIFKFLLNTAFFFSKLIFFRPILVAQISFAVVVIFLVFFFHIWNFSFRSLNSVDSVMVVPLYHFFFTIVVLHMKLVQCHAMSKPEKIRDGESENE